jgi:hypothetical protein
VVSTDIIDYIPVQKDIAMGNMKSAYCKHYSGARNSRIGCRQRRFMQTANNHFGIKCHAGWTGESVRHDDDARQECLESILKQASRSKIMLYFDR